MPISSLTSPEHPISVLSSPPSSLGCWGPFGPGPGPPPLGGSPPLPSPSPPPPLPVRPVPRPPLPPLGPWVRAWSAASGWSLLLPPSSVVVALGLHFWLLCKENEGNSIFDISRAHWTWAQGQRAGLNNDAGAGHRRGRRPRRALPQVLSPGGKKNKTKKRRSGERRARRALAVSEQRCAHHVTVRVLLRS